MNFLALHGFTQRGSMWDEVAALAGGEWSTPDLPGHGGRPACSWEEAVALVGGLLEGVAPPRCLVGYSMGGRLALAVALDHPSLVDRLVVVSAAAGIEEGADRQRRRAEDLALADRLEAMGVGAFVDEWLSRPLFAGLAARPPEWRAADREARAGNDAAGLAAALRLLGQGAQPYLGDRLGELRMPVLLVAGGRRPSLRRPGPATGGADRPRHGGGGGRGGARRGGGAAGGGGRAAGCLGAPGSGPGGPAVLASEQVFD